MEPNGGHLMIIEAGRLARCFSARRDSARYPGREAVAKKVSIGDRTTDIILRPDGK